MNPADTDAYFYRALVFIKKGDYHKAVLDFNNAIKCRTDDANLYCNRGVVFLHLKEWEKARADLITAKNMGTDIITSFHNDYESIVDFEQKHEIKLPEDIAAMLTPA